MSVVSRWAHVGPSWFASVMGTGIVANAAAVLPVRLPGLDALATAMWVVAATLLVVVTAATAVHWVTHRDVARGHLDDPVMSHFYGAPAMALMTVGAGALLVGHGLIGLRAAVVADTVLWTAGTCAGLATAWVVPRRSRRRPGAYTGSAFGGWLMPVVPPMVSAATGALLVPHLAPGLRPVMLATCWVMFAVALALSAPLILLIVRRALRGDVGAAVTVPTLFIVLGPLGQSVTAAHLLGEQSGAAVDRLSLAYGMPIASLAVVWLVVATTLVARTARTGLPFALTWWSFTFPVGTVVTGTAGLADRTGSAALAGASVALFAVLVPAWSVVAVRTVAGVRSGVLLKAPQTV